MKVSSDQEPKAQRIALKNGPNPRYGYEQRSLLSEEKPLKPTTVEIQADFIPRGPLPGWQTELSSQRNKYNAVNMSLLN